MVFICFFVFKLVYLLITGGTGLTIAPFSGAFKVFEFGILSAECGIGGRLKVWDKVGNLCKLLEDHVDLVGSKPDGSELSLVKDVPGTVSNVDGLVEKQKLVLGVVVARIGVDWRGTFAGSAGKLNLTGGTFGPSAGGSSGGPSGGSGFLIAIPVEGERILGELEDRLFSFLGGRNLILGASSVPAVGAGFFGNGLRNLIFPCDLAIPLALVVGEFAVPTIDCLLASGNETAEVFVEMSDFVTFFLAILADDGDGLVDVVLVVVVLLIGLVGRHLAPVIGAGLGEGAGHDLKLVL